MMFDDITDVITDQRFCWDTCEESIQLIYLLLLCIIFILFSVAHMNGTYLKEF